MNPLFRIDFSISDSLKIVRKSVLIYETIIKKAAQLQECIDEVNTANWYLCGKDMIVYTRVEEFYIPMDRMTLRSGRAVQVIQIGEEWVEIRSQGKVGYIRNSEFKQHFSKISIEIG